MWKAFVFGVVVAGSIGPIALLIFGTGARRGFATGAFAAIGPALADLGYALAAFSIGALVLPLLAAHEQGIRVGPLLHGVTEPFW
jgi:threonine/homoserine/homoserine lactone efflux protein